MNPSEEIVRVSCLTNTKWVRFSSLMVVWIFVMIIMAHHASSLLGDGGR